MYLGGITDSVNFPTQAAYDSTYNGGGSDAFVMKLSSSNTLVYSTFIGGAGYDELTALDVGPAGSVDAAGNTSSGELSLGRGYDPSFNGDRDGFLLRLQDDPTVRVTVNTQPPGLQMTIDGRVVVAPQIYEWVPGSTHVLSVDSPQGLGGFAYHFANWSDGGAQSHSVTTPTAAASYTAAFTSAPCNYDVGPTNILRGTGVSFFTISVTTLPGCVWAAGPTESWLVLLDQTALSGRGSAIYRIEPSAVSNRTTSFTVAGRSVSVTQSLSACDGMGPTVTSLHVSTPDTLSGETVVVNAAGGCIWSAHSNSNWIRLNQPASGNGPGGVHLIVAANPGKSRIGSVTIAGQNVEIIQVGTAVPGLSTGLFRAGIWLLDVDQNLQLDDINVSNRSDQMYQYSASPGDIPVSGDWLGIGRWGTGVFRNGQWFLDTNGDGRLVPGSADRFFQYSATPGDIPVTGDWNGDGFWDTGIFRDGAWFLDYNGDGVLTDINQPGGDRVFRYSATAGDIPVSGDWNGDGRWETGIFRSGTWLLDVNGDTILSNINQPGGDRVFRYSATPGDIPITGDWNGDHITDTGVFRDGVWILDYNGDGRLTDFEQPSGDRIFRYSATPGDRPVSGKWLGR